MPPEDLEGAIGRLTRAGRIDERVEDGTPSYRAQSIVIPLGARSGWEAAVYDHFHALVKTIVCKLRQDADGPRSDDRVGGSTYTFEVWPGHPLEDEVYGQLARFRAATSELRRQVEAHNDKSEKPARYDRVTAYMGQCVITEDVADE